MNVQLILGLKMLSAQRASVWSFTVVVNSLMPPQGIAIPGKVTAARLRTCAQVWAHSMTSHVGIQQLPVPAEVRTSIYQAWKDCSLIMPLLVTFEVCLGFCLKVASLKRTRKWTGLIVFLHMQNKTGLSRYPEAAVRKVTNDGGLCHMVGHMGCQAPLRQGTEATIWMSALEAFLVAVCETVSVHPVTACCLVPTIGITTVVELVAMFYFHVDVQD